MRKILLSLTLIGFAATSGIASDDHTGHDHSDMQDGVRAEVTINSISDGVANISHGPIPEIGWPAMTMDLNLLEGAEVGDLSNGDSAVMVMEKGDDGMFAIRELMPLE